MSVQESTLQFFPLAAKKKILNACFDADVELTVRTKVKAWVEEMKKKSLVVSDSKTPEAHEGDLDFVKTSVMMKQMVDELVSRSLPINDAIVFGILLYGNQVHRYEMGLPYKGIYLMKEVDVVVQPLCAQDADCLAALVPRYIKLIDDFMEPHPTDLRTRFAVIANTKTKSVESDNDYMFIKSGIRLPVTAGMRFHHLDTLTGIIFDWVRKEHMILIRPKFGYDKTLYIVCKYINRFSLKEPGPNAKRQYQSWRTTCRTVPQGKKNLLKPEDVKEIVEMVPILSCQDIAKFAKEIKDSVIPNSKIEDTKVFIDKIETVGFCVKYQVSQAKDGSSMSLKNIFFLYNRECKKWAKPYPLMQPIKQMTGGIPMICVYVVHNLGADVIKAFLITFALVCNDQ
ncbi:hypothetical protein BD560DRAFT_436110 [Blakeslea trispora]|nr:hypothetical protein BD560DRAFT_436110 [Blakeslea trispora]